MHIRCMSDANVNIDDHACSEVMRRYQLATKGKTEAFARKLAAAGKPLLTLDSPANANLVGLGAVVVEHADALNVSHMAF